jgi:hypothetical protein
LREIRLALLEADVNFKVVKAFVDRVRDRAMEDDVLKSLTASQSVVKIVRDEMLALFGDSQGGLTTTTKRPRVVILLGLQGAGKTTTAGKLAMWLTKQGRHPLLVSTDVKRPAAIQQLQVVGDKASVRVHDPVGQMDPVARAKSAVNEATNLGFDVVIVDSAGRLHIDDDLMTELVGIKAATDPSDLLYVADAMTGQDAIKSAGEFNRHIGVRRGADETGRRCTWRRGNCRNPVVVCRSRSSAAVSGAKTSSRFIGPHRLARAGHGRYCRSSNALKRRSIATMRKARRRFERTNLRSRISAINSGRSGRWGRSSRSWACCQAWVA